MNHNVIIDNNFISYNIQEDLVPPHFRIISC